MSRSPAVPTSEPSDTAAAWLWRVFGCPAASAVTPAVALADLNLSPQVLQPIADLSFTAVLASPSGLLGLGALLISGALSAALLVRLRQERTARARAEANLRECEARGRESFECAAVGMAYAELGSGRLLRINPCLRALLGRDAAGLLGSPFSQVSHADERAQDEALFRRLESGEAGELSRETRCVRPDGSVVWLLVTARTVHDATQRAMHAELVAVDVTARHQAERAQQATEERFRMFMAKNPAAAWILDLEGRFRYASPTYYKMFPVTHENLEGLRCRDLYPPEIAEAYMENNRKVFEGGQMVEAVEPGLRRAGGRGEFLVYKFPVPSTTGEKLLGGIALDITELKRADERVRLSEERFRQLADALPQLVWTAAPDGRIEYLNRRAAECAGAQASHDGGRVLPLPLHPDDEALATAAWRAALSDGRPCQVEHRILVGGEHRWHLSRSVPGITAGGRVERWYGTSTDIHDQKLTENALKDAHRRKDEFLAMLAHELRNPLAPIRYAARILAHPSTTPALLRQSSESIERQAAHMARLVDDLLDVSRVNHGRIRLRRQRLDFTALVAAFLRDNQPVYRDTGIRLELALPGHPLWVNGDPARLQQVVGNLLANAVKFTDPGGSVRLTLQDDGMGRAALSVEDTGVGIEPAQLSAIFEPFHQADRSLDRSKGGLGLGLALVKGLVELHGGDVRAESRGLGHGASFVVRLPLEQAFELRVPEPGLSHGHSPRRVLVIEDNPDAAAMLDALLRMRGHQVSVAHSGEEGVRRAHDTRPDVILCDIGLPGMDGYGVARALRADPHCKSARVIAITGYGDENRRRAEQAGFDHFITKPADPEMLERLLAT